MYGVRLMIMFLLNIFVLSLPLSAASADADIDVLVQELRSLATCFKEGGQCLREQGIKVRDLGKDWQNDARSKHRTNIEEYQNALLQKFANSSSLKTEDRLKSIEEMKQIRESGVAEAADAERTKDVKKMDFANERIRLWNKFVAKWKKLNELIKGSRADFDFSIQEAKCLLECGAEMMNDGMNLYFSGCDFDREADIFEEYGFDLTAQDFKKMCDERRRQARGDQ